jgi:hypothetical protein
MTRAREGEAHSEPVIAGESGSAGASPSRIFMTLVIPQL